MLLPFSIFRFTYAAKIAYHIKTLKIKRSKMKNVEKNNAETNMVETKNVENKNDETEKGRKIKNVEKNY